MYSNFSYRKDTRIARNTAAVDSFQESVSLTFTFYQIAFENTQSALIWAQQFHNHIVQSKLWSSFLATYCFSHGSVTAINK